MVNDKLFPSGNYKHLCEAAGATMSHQGFSTIWYGNFGLCEDVYEVYTRDKPDKREKHLHPISKISTVLREVSRCAKFRRRGYIKHLGRKYPVFELV